MPEMESLRTSLAVLQRHGARQSPRTAGGLSTATPYLLIYRGRSYDSKAILGVAHAHATGLRIAAYDLSWAILVRKSVGAVDGVEGLAQVIGDRVGSGDGLPSGPDLDGAVPAGCLDEFPG